MGFEPISSEVPIASDRAQILRNERKHVEEALMKSAELMEKYTNRKRADAPKYNLGDKVLLNTSHLVIKNRTDKFKERYIGPFPSRN